MSTTTATTAIPSELLEDVRFIAGAALNDGVTARHNDGWDSKADALMMHGIIALAATWQVGEPPKWFGPDWAIGVSRDEAIGFVARWYRDTMQEWINLEADRDSEPDDTDYTVEIARAGRVLASLEEGR